MRIMDMWGIPVLEEREKQITFKFVSARQLENVAEKYDLVNPIEPGSYFLDFIGSWKDFDAEGIVAYRGKEPIGWVMLSKDPEDESKAFIQRFVKPDERGKNISYQMAQKLIPKFKKKHPTLKKMNTARKSNRFSKLWNNA